MSFEITRDNASKNLRTDTIDTSNDDEFKMSRSPFDTNPTNFKDDQKELGMEFLVPQEEEIEDEEEDDEENEQSDSGDIFDEYPEPQAQQHHISRGPEMTYEEVQQKKSFYLSQLNRLAKRGLVSRRFGMEHSLEEIRGEVFRIKKEAQMDAGIDYCRQGLMFMVSTIEMADGKFKLGAELGGWSQAIMGNIESYDEVFEELYEKYFSNNQVGPEIKLISMLAGSAFMFSLQKRMTSGQGFAPRQREMEGPDIDTDELLRQLNDEVDLDDVSSVSGVSVASSEPLIVQPETKKIQIKKRGRPKKNA